jgi:hypothetical protein
MTDVAGHVRQMQRHRPAAFEPRRHTGDDPGGVCADPDRASREDLHDEKAALHPDTAVEADE